MDAATVVLVREGPGGLLVYMGKRNSSGSFAGAHVFPGGLVEKEDAQAGPAPHGRSPADLLAEPGIGEARARGLFTAAVRETFEESGVLLAAGPGDRPLPVGEKRFSDYRRKIAAREMGLSDMAEAEGLTFPFDRLLPIARWITPEGAPRRWDTRFFLSRLPDGQEASPDCEELVAGGWVSPAEALACQGRGGFVLFPPTYMTLFFLAGFQRAEDLFEAAAGIRITPIIPSSARQDGQYMVILPHDPEHPDNSGADPPETDGPSRLVLTETGWRPVEG